jgi:hypothetical protein
MSLQCAMPVFSCPLFFQSVSTLSERSEIEFELVLILIYLTLHIGLGAILPNLGYHQLCQFSLKNEPFVRLWGYLFYIEKEI